ncbi:MAG: efflux RND transporter periplasmic adaptor subunit, partial [Bradymonadaceae bacterium]
KDGEARKVVDVYAETGGTVTKRHAFEGEWVDVGDSIASLQGLDTVWIQLEVYEQNLPFVEEGTPVTITLPNRPGVEIESRIEFVDPVVNPKNGTARARVVASNADGREVDLGPKVGEQRIIKRGIEEGTEVAVNGAFQLDAELQIRGKASMMTGLHPSQRLTEQVEVPEDGKEFEPAIDPKKLPEGVFYCPMGKTHWAQHKKGDGECPVCGMNLKKKKKKSDESGGDSKSKSHDHGSH